MQIERYVRIVLKRWWLIVLVVVISMATYTYYTLNQPLFYRSKVILLLSPASNFSELYYADSPADASAQLAETYIYYLRTETFAESVIETEQLNMSPSALVGAVQVRMIEGTQFFEIVATAGSPEEAQLLATAIANNFIRQNVAQQRADVVARRSTGDVDNVNALLAEKLERERNYYEEQVNALRGEVERLNAQPPSTTRDELLAAKQARLSEYESTLMQIMIGQVELLPPIDESQFTNVTIAEAAKLPTNPVNSTNRNTMLYAFAAALALGIGLTIGLDYLDYTVRSSEEIELLTGQSPLGVLATIDVDSSKNVSGADVGPDVVYLTQPRSPTAEAVRALLTNLRFSGAGQQLRSLVITSAGPSEGKSVIAANLAVAFAQLGRRVILIDADLRRPTVHERFHLSRHPGLSDLMIDADAPSAAVVEKYLQPGPVDSLRILTSGPIPPNPAELLGTSWASALFDVIESQADIIIWDTPPTLTVTDAVIMAARADATIQVVKAGVTRRDMIVKTHDTLERVGANVLAPVLNQVKARDMGHYQYYYAKYGYQEGRSSGQVRARTDDQENGNEVGDETTAGHVNRSENGVKPRSPNRSQDKRRRRNALSP